MSFWLVAAFLTLAAALAVMFPFLRPPRDRAEGSDHDLEVYRDQLGELERDVARGTIGREEAAEARAEIGRRILRLERSGGGSARATGKAGRMMVAAAVLAVPLVSWSVYTAIGSPGVSSEPLEARLTKDPDDSTLQELVARAERHLAENPRDARGWDVLAPVYFRLGRYADAENAYRQAINLSGSTAARQAGLGEAITADGGGVVSADAEAAFQRALDLEPTASKPRFFLAMAKAQEGQTDAARTMWKAMQDDLPANSPWRGAVEQALAQLGPSDGGAGAAVAEGPAEAVAPSDAPGPSKDQMAAAAQMAPKDRMAMIEGMVSRLDQRLREQPGDAEAWQRLVRSYLVLGHKEKAADALKRGVAALGTDTDKAKKLQAFAASQGLEAAR
jgi:cytochrome c-type biogenesis protein CcmH